MKKLMILAFVALFAVSCGGNGKKTQQRESAETTRSTDIQTYKLDDLLTNAERLVNQKIIVQGYVTHTCKHSGKRCFIVGDDQKTSFRIEAKGNIGGFNRELIGSELAVTGTLKERRLSQEYLDQMGKDLNEQKAAENGSVESCEAEIANIEGMKAWMKENGKDYYAVYYMDGEDYDIIEER